MADPAPTGTVVPVPQGGGSPEFKVPEGKVLIDATEQQTWQRQREQLAGLTRFHGEATKRGFSKPDDFATYDKFDGVLKGKKLTMEQVAQILSGPEQEEAASGGGLDQSAIEKILADKGVMTKESYEKERNTDRAQTAHDRASETESSLIKANMKDLLGDKPTARDQYLIDRALRSELTDPENRQLYPEGHPLRDVAFAPMDEKGVKALIEKVKKNLAIEDGADMKKIGEAAGKGRPTPGTPAGNRAGQGKPEDKPTSGRPSDVIDAAVRRLSS